MLFDFSCLTRVTKRVGCSTVINMRASEAAVFGCNGTCQEDSGVHCFVDFLELMFAGVNMFLARLGLITIDSEIKIPSYNTAFSQISFDKTELSLPLKGSHKIFCYLEPLCRQKILERLQMLCDNSWFARDVIKF